METEAARFLAQHSPVMVTGTAPCITEVAQASILSVIAGLILTGLLCKTVKTAFSEPTESQRGPEAATPTVGPKPAPDDAAAKLRRLAQLRDSGVITEADFLAKKKTCRPMSRADAARTGSARRSRCFAAIRRELHVARAASIRGALAAGLVWQAWPLCDARAFMKVQWGVWPRGAGLFALGVWAGEAGNLEDLAAWAGPPSQQRPCMRFCPVYLKTARRLESASTARAGWSWSTWSLDGIISVGFTVWFTA